MTTINQIYFPDSEFTLKQVKDILKQKKERYKNKEVRFTLIIPGIKPTKRRVIRMANKKNNQDWRHKYPECPDCKAIGAQGLTTTRLGSLRCRKCNSMFELEHDKLWNIKVGKSMGD